MTIVVMQGIRGLASTLAAHWGRSPSRAIAKKMGVALAALIGDAAEPYDLTNIGTLFAFALVCAGVYGYRHSRMRNG